MRVCILTTSFPLYEGIAVGVHVIEQARHLVRRGVVVTVVAPHHRGAARRERIDGVEVVRFPYMVPARAQTLAYGAGIPTNLKNSWWARAQLPFLLLGFILAGWRQARGCDLIQANWSIAGLAAVLLRPLLRKPVVLVVYGAEIFVLGQSPLLRFIIRHSDALIAISRYTLEQTLAVQPHPRHALIPPGIDVTRFRRVEECAGIRERLSAQGVDWSLPLVMALGKFIERKGFSYLLEAMALLQARQPVQLMIGGRGPLKASLQEQAAHLGIGRRVFFLDYIPDGELPAYYSLADLFVSPSVVDARGDTEGLGMVLLEANACETPVVASAVGGIVDVVQDGYNGLLAGPADAADLARQIQRLLDDPALRRKMGQQGRQRVETEFAWPVQAGRIEAVYRALLP